MVPLGCFTWGFLACVFVSNFWEGFFVFPFDEWESFIKPFSNEWKHLPGITKAGWFALHLHLPAFTVRHIHDFCRKKCDEDHLEWQATLTATGLDRRGVDTRALHDGRFLGIWKYDWRSCINYYPYRKVVCFKCNCCYMVIPEGWFEFRYSPSICSSLVLGLRLMTFEKGMSLPLFLDWMKHICFHSIEIPGLRRLILCLILTKDWRRRR